jgi:hypothetical protein
VIAFFKSDGGAHAHRSALGAAMLTETMERRPEKGFASYDRFFPSHVGRLGRFVA